MPVGNLLGDIHAIATIRFPLHVSYDMKGEITAAPSYLNVVSAPTSFSP